MPGSGAPAAPPDPHPARTASAEPSARRCQAVIRASARAERVGARPLRARRIPRAVACVAAPTVLARAILVVRALVHEALGVGFVAVVADDAVVRAAGGI